MAISHADHDHPNTPAARAKCRRAMDNTHVSYVNLSAERQLAEQVGVVKPAKIVSVQPIGARRGPKGPMRGATNIKKPGTVLRTIGDLPDVPRMLAYGARLAWANDWPVRVGEPFNDNEARIVIDAPAGEIALVWRPSLPDGVWGVFFRPGYNSITNRLNSVQEAFAFGVGEEA